MCLDYEWVPRTLTVVDRIVEKPFNFDPIFARVLDRLNFRQMKHLGEIVKYVSNLAQAPTILSQRPEIARICRAIDREYMGFGDFIENPGANCMVTFRQSNRGTSIGRIGRDGVDLLPNSCISSEVDRSTVG